MRGKPFPGDLTLFTNRTYWFRITSVNTLLSELLLTRFYEQPPETLVILERGFLVEAAFVESKDHSWAGSTNWETLVAPLLNSRQSVGPIESKLRLIFHSPTTFKAGGRTLPLPLPAQLFGSLVNRWNNFSPVPFDPELAVGHQPSASTLQSSWQCGFSKNIDSGHLLAYSH